MVSFAEPSRLALLLLPGVAAVAAVWRHRTRLRQQRALASPAVWERLMGGVPATGLLRMLLWCAAAAALAVALARPQWGVEPTQESVESRDLVVALDVSDSMRCPDVPPSRLAHSLQILHRALPALAGNRIGVVVFAGDAYPLIPLTTDLDAAAMFLETVEPGMVALPGSNIERAAAAALELLPEEGEARVVVLVTDGENLQGDPVAAAERLRRSGVGVLALVAGTEAGGPIPIPAEDGTVRYKRDRDGRPVVTHAQPEVLARLAETAGGELLHLAEATDRDLVELVAQLRTRELEARQRERRVERFPVLLAAAALLLVSGFLVSPWRRTAFAVLVMAALTVVPAAAQGPSTASAPQAPMAEPSAAHAQDPAQRVAWWQRWLPGGARRLAREGLSRWRKGDAEEAAGAFAGALELADGDPEREFDYGTALAAAGDLEGAVHHLDRAAADGVVGSAYNAGTAALAQGQAELAVERLRQALLANPGGPEVKRNYELALRLLEQQQQQQQQQQQDQEQQPPPEENEPQPTPTPDPVGDEQSGPPPTPTPDPSAGLYAALERAEEEAREALQSPTPQPGQVEKDW